MSSVTTGSSTSGEPDSDFEQHRLPLKELMEAKRKFSPLQTHYPDEHEFFHYTSGRWLRNDETERAKRYIRFNVNALCGIAATSVGARECLSIAKLDEGGFNRAFLLRLDNGTEVVARIPLPISGPPHLLTASEVATLDFVRNVMEIPAPKVLAWSSRAESTPVGTEFIILEKVDGVHLHYAMQNDGRSATDRMLSLVTLPHQIVDIEEKFCDHHFSMFGSLFYKEDVVGYPHSTQIFADENRDSELTQKFAIGPHMSHDLWHGERKEMDVDRGPWNTFSEYITGFIRCEQEWLRRFAKQQPKELFDFSAENSDPEKHIAILDDCIKISPYIVPQEETHPVMWHPDLHKGNIFVAENEPHLLKGIIDWQFTGISPFIYSITVPKAFRYSGSRVELLPNTANVKLPDDFDSLPSKEKELVRDEEFDATMFSFYRYLGKKINPPMHVPLHHQDFSVIVRPFTTAMNSWEKGLAVLQFHLLTVQARWKVLAEKGQECPLQLTEEEMTRIVDDFKRIAIYQRKYMELLVKIGWEGNVCVDPDSYDAIWAAIIKEKSSWDRDSCGSPYPFVVEEEGSN